MYLLMLLTKCGGSFGPYTSSSSDSLSCVAVGKKKLLKLTVLSRSKTSFSVGPLSQGVCH